MNALRCSINVSDTLILVIMYAVGSIPFAYILSLRAGVDLRQHGSRNIGARNAFEVTKRKDIGVAVLVLDVLKGLIPTLLLSYYMDDPPILPLAMVVLIVGHCYPVWLRFHGGRGLATAAGILAVSMPLLIGAWLLLYLLLKTVTQDVHLRSVIALLLLIPLVFLEPLYAGSIVYSSRDVDTFGMIALPEAILMIIGVILTRHIQPLLSIAKSRP